MSAREALGRPVDAAGLAAFRIVFGALLAIGTLRLLQKGFVHEAFVVPHAFFAPWPFASVLRPLPSVGMYGVYFALVVLAIAIAAGAFTRMASALFCALFTYAHFVDLTNYLNHYWLVTLVAALFVVIDPSGTFSIDARFRGRRRETVPAWHLTLLRFQIGVVYIFAGVAKLGGDWLFRAQPMRIWLAANTDIPLVGPLFAMTSVAYAASWFAAFYDLTIPFWLLWRRSRPYAYGAVVFFHLLTARLFNIGMFPYLMIAGSLLFLDPSWPRRTQPIVDRGESISRRTLAALVIYVAIQLLVPLRAHLYGGNGLWHEQGYRFAWNVMRMEKMGSAEFTLVDRATGTRKLVRVRDHLTPWQEKAMATQPDLILAFAQYLARSERRRGNDVAVHADVFVVLNGRESARLIDPIIDLAQQRDGLLSKRWILPAPP
jgi:vitamin K-dependent gamma-carboxylase